MLCVDRKTLRRSISDGFLQNHDKILKSGYLVKQGHIVKNWKKRWFVLRYYTLSYFDDEEAIHPLRTIQLSDVKDLRRSANMIEMDVGKRTFLFKCDVEQDTCDWISAIRSRAFGAENTAPYVPTSKDRSSRVASLMKKYAAEDEDAEEFEVNDVVPVVKNIDTTNHVPEKKGGILSKSFYISTKEKSSSSKTMMMSKAASVAHFNPNSSPVQ
eukprot:TRINITY_DN3402_c1_g1_i1.p1 TRINITY_DN3402_c1_g1~~TRINITY_DN3402_c1_g1_i1.p1  ORF type:complete len:213 (+),score=38.64 TRINITY_DN3402_c1_g1_i1:257-895(+)